MKGIHSSMNQNSDSTDTQEQVNWLFLDLNSYFASVEQQMNPKLRGKPVAVVPMIADSTCCIAVSYEAKKFGVKTLTTVRDAKKLCPEIIFISGNHNHYIEYHHRIIATVENCIHVSAVMSIDEMACELIGSERNLPKATEIANKIKQRMRVEVGEVLTCSIGLAPNRFLAKVASDMQKPNGLTTILPSTIQRNLLKLKLRDLPGIGHNMEVRLNKFGVREMSQLLDLSKKELAGIWGGINGERFYDLLKGRQLPEIETTRGSFSHSHVLPPDLRNGAGAYAVGQKLVHKLGVRLRKNNYWCQELFLSIRFIDGTKWTERQGFSEVQDNFTLLRAFQKMWVKRPKKSSPPIKIGVWIDKLVPNDLHNFSFFENQKLNTLSHSMDAINDKFGRNAIYFGGIETTKKAFPVRIAFSNIPEVDEEEN